MICQSAAGLKFAASVSELKRGWGNRKLLCFLFCVCLPFSSKFISWPNKNLVLFKNKPANKPQNRHFLWIFNFSGQQVVENEEERAKPWQGGKLPLCWSFKNWDKTAAGCLPQGCCFSLALSGTGKTFIRQEWGISNQMEQKIYSALCPFLFFSWPPAPQTQHQTRGSSRASSPTCTPTLQGQGHILGLGSSLFNYNLLCQLLAPCPSQVGVCF